MTVRGIYLRVQEADHKFSSNFSYFGYRCCVNSELRTFYCIAKSIYLYGNETVVLGQCFLCNDDMIENDKLMPEEFMLASSICSALMLVPVTGSKFRVVEVEP